MRRLAVLTSVAFLALAMGCDSKSGAKGGAATAKRSGAIKVDGSSTVFPITEAIAEEFRAVEPRVRVTIGVSGTGGGFKKFAEGATDINDASRPIKDEESKRCAENKIDFVELPVAFDGIVLVVNPKNSFVDKLSTAELKKIWGPGSKIKNWKEVREGFPDLPLRLYGPGADSGTFDYFTKAINGKEQACRSDYTASEDDNVLVTGVSGDQGGLGFFGFAYYAENAAKLKLVPIDNGKATVNASEESINDGSYAPLSRPIFIYVNKASLAKPQVQSFLEFYLAQASALVKDVGYIPLPKATYDLAKKRLADQVTGTIFNEASRGMSLDAKLKASTGS